MKEKTNYETIEIKGVKFEVDMSTAKKVEEFRVGDKVKVLQKTYGDKYEIRPGIIIGFEWFETHPTITIAYLEMDYSGAEIKFLYYNNESTEVEISHTDNMELIVEPADVYKKIADDIQSKELEIEGLKRKREYFKNNFKVYFEDLVEQVK